MDATEVGRERDIPLLEEKHGLSQCIGESNLIVNIWIWHRYLSHDQASLSNACPDVSAQVANPDNRITPRFYEPGIGDSSFEKLCVYVLRPRFTERHDNKHLRVIHTDVDGPL